MRTLAVIAILLAASTAEARLMAHCNCPTCYKYHPNNVYRLRDEAAARQNAIAVSPQPALPVVSIDRGSSVAGTVSETVYGTPKEAIEILMDLWELDSDSVLLDLGCGDGRILIAAAKRYGCFCIGVEKERRLVNLARKARAAAGLSSRRVEIILADATLHEAMYKSATHVYMYQYAHLSKELIDLVPKDAVVLCYEFPVPERRCHRIVRGGHTFFLVER